MRGLMINASGSEVAEFEWPGQPPLFYVDDGETAVFEVWFHDAESDLWFVMTTTPQAPSLRGGIGFHPLLSQSELRTVVQSWRDHVRAVRVTGH